MAVIKSVTLGAIILAGAVSLTRPAPVAAQGIGHGQPPVDPGRRTNSSPPTTIQPPSTDASTPSSSRSPASRPTTSVRLQTFGSWLDSAGVSAPGEAWISVASAYWRSSLLREVDAPSVGLVVGIARRMQLGVSLPYSHITDQSGFTSRGFGASYVTTKFVLSENPRLAASTSPTVEILTWSSPNTGRVNFVLPISLQTSAGRSQIYGSTGYFTRGSLFGSGAVEWPVNAKTTLAGTLAHTRWCRIRRATHLESHDIAPMAVAASITPRPPEWWCSQPLAARSCLSMR